MTDSVIRALAVVADTEASREDRARAAAEIVRGARDFGWVGIYDVGDEEIGAIGYTGAEAPADLRFGAAQGLSGEAVRTRMTILSDDRSEAIVPILGPESGIVIGTLDARGDRAGAFSIEDVSFLEECAAVLRPLFD
jgi:L-methionine (R)-S-oxide reductase